MKRKKTKAEETGVEGRTREKLLIYVIEAVKHRQSIALNLWLETENYICTLSV